jgi:hemerythrin
MPLLWRDPFSVGNDLIDTDHRYLIEIINKAETCMKSRKRSDLIAVIDELNRYGRIHFECEELIARAVGYPQAEQLQHSHEHLSESLEKFKSGIGDHWDASTMEQISTFLRDWLINHVIKEDLLMKPWLVKHSPRFDPRAG